VTAYGFGPARLDVHSAAAAASRFDQLLGTHFFDQIYGRGIDVYGAYPSLHVAYPLLAVWATFRARELRWARVPAICFFLLMCLSAVYLQHHYVIDVLLGIAYAIATLALLAKRPATRKRDHRSAARASPAQPWASGSPSAKPDRRAGAPRRRQPALPPRARSSARPRQRKLVRRVRRVSQRRRPGFGQRRLGIAGTHRPARRAQEHDREQPVRALAIDRGIRAGRAPQQLHHVRQRVVAVALRSRACRPNAAASQ